MAGKSETLPRKARITLKRDFERILEKGKTFHTRNLVIKTLENELDFSRLGTIVRKRTNSVDRNRVKRCLREAFRTSRGELKSGLDIVLIPRRNSEVEVEAFARDLKSALGAKP